MIKEIRCDNCGKKNIFYVVDDGAVIPFINIPSSDDGDDYSRPSDKVFAHRKILYRVDYFHDGTVCDIEKYKY